MRVAHYLIRGATGLFYVRLRVPIDLQEVVGARIIKRATGTRCPRTALAFALVLSAGYARSFAALRAGEPMTKPPSIDEIKTNLAGGRKSDYLIERASDGSITKLEAKGKADHERMMAAVNAIGYIGPQTTAPATPTCEPLDMEEGIRMWGLTLPTDSPGQRKGSGSKVSKVRAFQRWKHNKTGAAFRIDQISRTDFAEYFVACKASTTKRGKPPAPRYIENQFLVNADFLDWAMTSGYYPDKPNANPARGHAQVPKKERTKRAKSHGWQPFKPTQLMKIFNPTTYASMRGDDARWLPLMALYTGARSNELAHLEIEDCYELIGQPLFDFNLQGLHKSLKTDASERKTPVHPDLIALGLWARVKRLRDAGETKLFPELDFLAQNGPANAGQRAFSRYLERLGIGARGHGKLGLHSFRDTVITTMKERGVRRELREEYCGHELSSRGDHDEAYGEDFLPHNLAALCHPALSFGLDLPRLRALLGEPDPLAPRGAAS